MEHLRRFESLLYLNVDETQLSGADLVRVFSGRKDVKLRELSLVNLNGVTWNEMNRGYTNGLLKCLDLERLADCLPHLEYISLRNSSPTQSAAPSSRASTCSASSPSSTPTPRRAASTAR